MRHFDVVSPEWTYVEEVYYGRGPTYEIRDYAHVTADTKREARTKGAKAMHAWQKVARGDQRNPFAGVRVVEEFEPCDHGGCAVCCEECGEDW